jgi:thiamine-phosphate pyrophosphorylase
MSAPHLYLITPPLVDAGPFVRAFEAALASGEVASVLVRLARGADAKKVVAPLLEIAQRLDVALLIEDDSRLAARLDADGVHVSCEGVAEAGEAFKGKRIVGAGGVGLRDDAMSAGEAGADYVMFGEPGPDGAAASREATLERVDWGAPIFETPCVAYAAALEDVAPLFAAGADFVALGAAVWDAPDPAEAVKAAAKA